MRFRGTRNCPSTPRLLNARLLSALNVSSTAPKCDRRRHQNVHFFIDGVETLTVLPCVMILASTTVNSKNRVTRRISYAVVASEDTGEPCCARTDLSRMTIVHEQFLPNHNHTFVVARVRRRQESTSAIHSEGVFRRIRADDSAGRGNGRRRHLCSFRCIDSCRERFNSRSCSFKFRCRR